MIPVFKTEASLWEMVADGRKTWEARLYDKDDWRFQYLNTYNRYDPIRRIRLLNKQDGRILEVVVETVSEYPWAPGWVFITFFSPPKGAGLLATIAL